MEECIAIVKQETLSDIELPELQLELAPVPGISDSICHKSKFKQKADTALVSSEPKSHHVNEICLNIRIAIIRCFYSSLSCPATALQMLKKEDEDLCLTVSIEDINFFVQKFEKTGSVIDNHIDNPSMDSEDMLVSRGIVETVFNDAVEDSVNDANECDIEDCQLSIDETYKQLNNQAKQRKRKASTVRKCKKVQITDESPETPEEPPAKKRSKRRYAKTRNQKFPPLGKFQCRICKIKCTSSSAFKYHFLTHFNMTFVPKLGPHKCPGCHKVFNRNDGLYNHIFYYCRLKEYDLSENKSSDSACDSNDAINTSLSKLSKEKDFKFPEETSLALQDQVESDHETVENTNTKDPMEKVHKCPRCPEILPNRRSLTYHVLEHFDLSNLGTDPPYNCPDCDKPYLKRQSLYNHLRKACHKRTKKHAATPFDCHICKKAFQFELQLEHHLLVHEGKAKLRECHFCQKRFDTYSGFRYHLLSSHSEKKIHQCDVCDRNFHRLKLLEEHKLSHSGTYLYTCEFCSKKCDTQTCYRAHLKTHTEKSVNWQCELCGKYYSGKSYKKSYEQHMRTHTGEIVAVCDLCGKGFNHKGNLKVHYKSCQRNMLESQAVK